MHRHIFGNGGMLYSLLYRPLYTALAIATVKISAFAAFEYRISLAVEQVLFGSFGFQVRGNAPGK
jgi:hypothetical protein